MDRLPDSVLHHLREVTVSPELAGTRYTLLDEVGRGGMGTVYRVRDSELDREVALKVLNVESSAAAERLIQEARILARLEHPGIVPVHDAGLLPDGRVFYVMKLVRGVRLDAYALRNPPLTERLRVFLRILDAVAFAHASGVIHRDLKPENVMLGEFGEVLVLDWGVAQRIGCAETGLAVGTPDFMAPEQAAGLGVTPKSDVFSLGRMLECLTHNVEENRKRLRAIAAKASAERPVDRYASALEMAADITRLLDGEPLQAYRENVMERAGRLLHRHQTAAALVLAYLAMRILLILFSRR